MWFACGVGRQMCCSLSVGMELAKRHLCTSLPPITVGKPLTIMVTTALSPTSPYYQSAVHYSIDASCGEGLCEYQKRPSNYIAHAVRDFKTYCSCNMRLQDLLLMQ
jgi:hypothetical protein